MKIIRSLSAISIAFIFLTFACKDEVMSSNLTNCYSCTHPDADIYDDTINVCDPDVTDKIAELEDIGYDCIKN